MEPPTRLANGWEEALEFTFSGPDAQADAEALGVFLAREFPDWRTHRPSTPAPTQGTGRRDLPIAIPILALILTAPAALKHSLDLADRLKLQSKFDRLIAWAKERRAQASRNPFLAVPPSGASVPLAQAKPEQLLEAVAPQTPKPPSEP